MTETPTHIATPPSFAVHTMRDDAQRSAVAGPYASIISLGAPVILILSTLLVIVIAAAFLGSVPPAVGLLFVFPAIYPSATEDVIVATAEIALVNGTLEEVFWRGTFLRAFPKSPGRGVIYPAIMFGRHPRSRSRKRALSVVWW